VPSYTLLAQHLPRLNLSHPPSLPIASCDTSTLFPFPFSCMGHHTPATCIGTSPNSFVVRCQHLPHLNLSHPPSLPIASCDTSTLFPSPFSCMGHHHHTPATCIGTPPNPSLFVVCSLLILVSCDLNYSPCLPWLGFPSYLIIRVIQSQSTYPPNLLGFFTPTICFLFYIPHIFQSGLRDPLGLCTHYLRLGLCTPLFFLGFTHPYSSWDYAPVNVYHCLGLRTLILLGTMHPLSLLGFTHPPGLRPDYFAWVYAPTIFTWAYALLFYLGLRSLVAIRVGPTHLHLGLRSRHPPFG
jgi:hypothetical protein